VFTVVVMLRSSLRACRYQRELLVEAVQDAHQAVTDGAESALVEDERGEILEAVSFEDLVSTREQITSTSQARRGGQSNSVFTKTEWRGQ
jgi:hypothetical protein